MDFVTGYHGLQDDLIELVTGSSGRAGVPVPACPGWSTGDVMSHVVGLAEDASSGRLPPLNLMEQWRDADVAADRDAMTAAQVGRRRQLAADDRARDWRALGDVLDPMLGGTRPFPPPAMPYLSAVLVTDLVVHDQDVRAALGAPHRAEGADLSIALASYAFGVEYRITQLGLPALRLRYAGKDRTLGVGDPAASLSADRYDLVRVLAGRRNREQIAALSWEGDAAPYLPLLPAYGEREDPLED